MSNLKSVINWDLIQEATDRQQHRQEQRKQAACQAVLPRTAVAENTNGDVPSQTQPVDPAQKH
jgi:hypothetical protein